MQKVVLRPITKKDLIETARIHIDAFPDAALTKLGKSIIQKYYDWQLIGPHKKVLAKMALVNNECVGFCFSGAFNGSISGFINHNRFFLIKEVLKRPYLLLNSLFLKRLQLGIKLLRRLSLSQETNTKIHSITPKSFGILAIAVSSQYQKLGIGKRLMLDAEHEAKKCGFKQMHLSVNPKNHKAIQFYQNLNWKKSLQNDIWKGLMIKIL